MTRTKTIFAKNGVSIADHGAPEYLDGARMQFTVCLGARYPTGRTLAYFDDEEDALLFAKAKARRRARTKAHKCSQQVCSAEFQGAKT